MEVSTVKKEVQKEVETSEKIWGYVAGEGEVENGGKSLWSPEKGPKKFLKNYFLEKVYRRCLLKILTW